MKIYPVLRFGTSSKYVITFLIPLMLCASKASATDYISIQQSIQNSESSIDALETDHGRYDEQLLEPLEQLAKIQLEASRFEDAAQTIDRAIQIARISHGLYTSAQYPLLQLEIDISRSRGDWEDTEEQMAHFVWLVASRFDGDRIKQLDTLNWLANKHLQCALETTDVNRATYLIKSTQINEYAVQLAQATRHTQSPVYADLLYGLSQKYYVETRGVLGDKASSYKLRVLDPYVRVVEEKASALERRYAAGLDKLVMLRDSIALAPTPSAEALGMAEIYIADWQLAFNNSRDEAGQYTKALGLLRNAGIAEAQLERFFAHPVVIPRQEFTLNFAEALAAVENASGPALVTVETMVANASATAATWQLSIREDSDRLPGVVSELSVAQLGTDLTNNWNLLTLSLEFDPAINSRFRQRGYSMSSKAIPSAIRVASSSKVSEQDLQAILTRIKSLPFRPALRQGVPIPATITVNYVFRENGETPLEQMLTLR